MPKKKPPVKTQDLRKEYLQKRIRDLFREIIGGLTLSEVVLPEKLEGQERINFAKYCHETYHSQYFKQILEALYFPQIMHIGTKALDIEEMTFNRATANGIMLVAEMYQKWANIYDEEFSPDQKNQKFDPNKQIATINE